MVAESAQGRVESHLTDLQVAHESLDCDPDLADTANFCAHYGVALADSCNAILVKAKRGGERYALCLVLADCKLSNRAIRRVLGTSKASFATADETRALTGMVIGGVSPFGLPSELPIFVDARVFEREVIVVGGGSRALKVRIAPSELHAIPGLARVEGLAEPLLGSD
ncbi:MAG: hypothetical protein CL928_16370 [Deltaproteobacteria bacterium]|nr:hypothetical protein [Deltaproteobacteria bacterium]|tara:strand:- start:1396 stop:1899 length:504 start_codon:yes stop_codon:yes gene_type:complete